MLLDRMGRDRRAPRPGSVPFGRRVWRGPRCLSSRRRSPGLERLGRSARLSAAARIACVAHALKRTLWRRPVDPSHLGDWADDPLCPRSRPSRRGTMPPRARRESSPAASRNGFSSSCARGGANTGSTPNSPTLAIPGCRTGIMSPTPPLRAGYASSQIESTSFCAPGPMSVKSPPSSALPAPKWS